MTFRASIHDILVNSKATLMFSSLQKDAAGNFVALAVAGGGGGMSFKVGSNAIKANGGLIQGGSGLSAATPYDGPGLL